MDSTTPTQNRRVMSASSALGPVSAVTITGSSAIPQMGHDPGPGCRISGCIGQVHSATSASAGTQPRRAAAWPWPAWSCPAWRVLLRAGVELGLAKCGAEEVGRAVVDRRVHAGAGSTSMPQTGSLTVGVVVAGCSCV